VLLDHAKRILGLIREHEPDVPSPE
jgi:hypothetical protein